MKKKTTTIEEGSCSRIARPRKALDRRAQCRPSSKVSPKEKRGRGARDSFMAVTRKTDRLIDEARLGPGMSSIVLLLPAAETPQVWVNGRRVKVGAGECWRVFGNELCRTGPPLKRAVSVRVQYQGCYPDMIPVAARREAQRP